MTYRHNVLSFGKDVMSNSLANLLRLMWIISDCFLVTQKDVEDLKRKKVCCFYFIYKFKAKSDIVILSPSFLITNTTYNLKT
jgi:hypothetical protein